MPILSVVTITFNDHEGLKNTFASLDTQTIEWIVIDGSNDPSILKLNRDLLLNNNIQIIQEPDQGRFDAMNKGLQLAKGELICFLNGGDRFATLSTPNEVLKSYADEDWMWAVGKTIAVDSKGEKLWNWPMPNHNSLKLTLGINSYCHQATFVRRKMLIDLGGFDKDSLYSDWITSLKLSRIEKPFLLHFHTTSFLADGISSQQSIEYWRKESIKLRQRHRVMILNLRTLDFFMQWLAYKFISTTRGKLIRPDLVKKYG